MVRQINIDEAPGSAHLGAWDRTGLGASLQRVGVNAEEGSSFDEVERAHDQEKCLLHICSIASHCRLLSMRVSRPASR